MKKLIYLSFFGLLSFLYSCSSQINIDPKTLEEITTSNQFTFMAERANPTNFDVMGESVQALLKQQVMSLVGKQLATSLLKLIPGFGQIINAAVAGALTFALGSTMIELYSKAYKEYLDTGKLPDWTQVFSSSAFFEIFSKYRDEYKNNK
jgi:hypothetical protein